MNHYFAHQLLLLANWVTDLFQQPPVTLLLLLLIRMCALLTDCTPLLATLQHANRASTTSCLLLHHCLALP